MKTVTAVSVFLLFLALASGQEDWINEYGGTGNDLISLCRSSVRKSDEPNAEFDKQEVYNAGYCDGFVSGVADFVQQDATLSGVPRSQLVRVVQKYLSDHPEQLGRVHTTSTISE